MDALSMAVVGIWLVLHVGALAWAWATRLASGSRLELGMQAGFFALMAAVGFAAWICREVDIEVWPVSAVTLIAMVLTAVVDFRRLEPVHSKSSAANR